MTATEYFNKAFAADPNNFYITNTIRYLEADEQTRKETKAHWIQCHIKNIADDRSDLYIFSSKILVGFALAEAILEEQKAS